MEKQGRMGVGSLLATMALFVVLGIPLVGYLWETLNQLLAGHVGATRLLASVPVALLLALVLSFLSRRLKTWEARHVD